MSNAARFNYEVLNFTQKLAPEKFALFMKKIVLLGLKGVVLRTPVDTGRARGNWQVTINAPHEGKTDQTDRTGNAAISKGRSSLGALPNNGIGQQVHLCNNVEYIQDLEDGLSVQAPGGMVEPTIADLTTIFEK